MRVVTGDTHLVSVVTDTICLPEANLKMKNSEFPEK